MHQKLLRFLKTLLFSWTALAGWAVHAADAPGSVRLYALDCGHATFKDLGMFADTGEYDGKPGTLATPCFLIHHAKGTLLWDTGLDQAIAAHKDGLAVEDGAIRLFAGKPLEGQLRRLGLELARIDFVAFSHFHFDHTGNANLLSGATWILNKAELDWAIANPEPFGVNAATFSAHPSAKKRMIEGDHDVFGDGTVRILKAPGHTPGHQVLALKLRNTGLVVLSGDLYHTIENRKHRRVPGFNHARGETLASMDRIERIVKNGKGRLIVQHDPADYQALPAPPRYLD